MRVHYQSHIVLYYMVLYDLQKIGLHIQGVQRILFLRSIVLDFVKFNLFALILLCVTQCTMWRLYFAFVNCLQHLEILSEI